MPKIAQGDVFCYLNRRGKNAYHTEEEIAEAVNRVFHTSLDKSAVNGIKRGKKPGRGDLNDLGKIDQFYQALFPEEPGGDVMRAMLDDALAFVRENELRFDGWSGLPEDTFETYTKRMLTYALSNPGCNARKQPASPAYSLHPDSLAFCRFDFFTGREDLLAGIQEHLDQDRLAVLTGMGGIGKSTLATRFAYNNSDRYSSIQIVSSELQESFEKVVLALRFDGLKDEKETLQRRLELLQQLDERTLIIIDNVDAPWKDIQRFYEIQREMKFHLIITSRLTDVFRKQFCLPVTPLSDGAQRELFIHHYGLDQEEQPDSPILDEILRRIEGHTLLIELIAKTMYNESGSFEEMLEWLRGQKADHEFMEDGERKDPKEVIRKMLFRDRLDDSQRELLYRLAFLPTEGVSRRLFLHRLCLGDKSSLSLLEGRSWVIREGDRIRVHPVIRDAVRGDMPLAWTDHGEFLRLIQEALEQKPGGLSEEDQISLCLLARGMWETLHGSGAPLELWDRLSVIARHCKTVCQYETALRLCELLSRAEEDMADVDKRIELHLEIGGLHQRLADYHGAIEHYQRALDMTREDDDQRGSCYNSLGVIYRKNADYEEAVKNFEAALRCYKSEDLIATTQNDLGVVYINLGSNEPDPEKSRAFFLKAKENYEGSLRLREKKPDAVVRDLAFSHHNIGSALYRLGEYEGALKEHSEALRMREDSHQQKPDIAASLNWIGNDLIQLERLPEARENLEKSLAIRKKALGEHHPDLAWALISLSEYHEKVGELSRAVQLMREACAIRRDQLRPGHPYTRTAEQRLEELMKKAGE